MEAIAYGMSFEDYYNTEGVNASFLSEFKRTPAHGKAYLSQPKKENDAFKMGTLVHRMILEPDLGAHGIVTRPDGLDFRSKEGKAWREAQAGKAIISAEEKRDLIGIVNAVLTHPVASQFFAEGEPEVSLFAPFNYGGTCQRKGRVDFLPSNLNAIPDLKTCNDAGKHTFERDIYSYDYYLKAAYYLDLAKALGLEKEVFVFVCVEKTAPYAVKLYQLNTEAIGLGRKLYIDLLQRYMECVEKNHWPAYPEEIEIINLSSWALSKAA